MPSVAPEPFFFDSAGAFREWLEANHENAVAVLVGFHKRHTSRPSLTWSEAVDQALCFGWIDGIRRSLGGDAYTIRFTRRKPGSNWSAVNIRKVEELTTAGLMRPAGLKAFEGRLDSRSRVYSYEDRNQASLAPAQEDRFRANARAWAFFQAQPPGYRRTAMYWVSNAKQEATRDRRLIQLISDSEAGRRVGPLARPGTGETTT
jgi:uncharacterized protein YdeI (YjbR/CyaY-like superfamily)